MAEGDGPPRDDPGRERGPSGDRPSPLRRAAGFVLAALGIVLVAVTPNPPESFWDWVFVVSGASLTGFLTAYAGRHELLRFSLRHRGTRILRWLVRRRVAVAVAVLLSVVLAFGIPPAWDVARGVAIDVGGCPPATQLRMVATPETVTTARELAADYERWTAAENHGCPAADVYVYAAGSREIRARLQRADGWSDETDALAEVGPRPDVWLAATSHETAGLAAVAKSTPVAVSPVVVAAPEAAARRVAGDGVGWAEMFGRLRDQGVGVVRADPGQTELGLLSTALLYGLPGGSGPRASPAEIERYLAASLDAGGFPPTDTPGLLCRHRLLGSASAVVASEQLVVRFNRGEPLGQSCVGGSRGRLVALYPADTRGLDHQLVRMTWSRPPQADAAAALETWLGTEAGKDAIVRTGLRPLGTFTVGPTLTTNGVDPLAPVSPEPVPDAALTGAVATHELAQRRGRVIFAVDTSGSMATAGPDGVRSAVAAAAVTTALRGMGPRDEFGLWFFPDAAGTGHVDAVPLGPPDDGRVGAARAARGGGRPVGNTPLFRTMADAAAAVRSADDSQVEAVVVLTDGEDTSSGIGADAVGAALAGSGVRLVVVTIGEVRCSDAGLAGLAAGTAGECIDADLPNLDAALGAATAGLWGGR